MFCKCVRECSAGLNFCCYLLKYFLEGLIFYLLSKGLDTSEQGDTGGKEGGKLTGKDYNDLGADLRLEKTYCSTLFFGIAFFFVAFAVFRPDAAVTSSSSIENIPSSTTVRCMRRVAAAFRLRNTDVAPAFMPARLLPALADLLLRPSAIAAIP